LNKSILIVLILTAITLIITGCAKESPQMSMSGTYTCTPKCPTGYYITQSLCYLNGTNCYGYVYCNNTNGTFAGGTCVKQIIPTQMPKQEV